MRRLVPLVVLALLLVACQEAHMQDIDTPTRWGELSLELDEDQLTIQPFDKIDVFQNLNEHPNLARVCADGVAFVTTTRESFGSIQRVEAWDAYCQDHQR